jgi:hypothetical protein
VTEADAGSAACSCGGETFELAVGFSFQIDGDVRWVTVGARCMGCHGLGVYSDWKIDYGPTLHLLSAT